MLEVVVEKEEMKNEDGVMEVLVVGEEEGVGGGGEVSSGLRPEVSPFELEQWMWVVILTQ